MDQLPPDDECIKDADSVNNESDSANHESDSVNYESDSVNHESDSANHESDSVNHESDSVNHESDSVNHESNSANHESETVNHEEEVKEGTSSNPDDPETDDKTENRLAKINLNFEGVIKMGEIQLTAEEFDCLKGKRLLEDQVIYFFMEYYRTVVFHEFQPKIEILGPALMVFLMSLDETANEAEWFDQLNNLKLLEKELILMVVHKQHKESAHWTLLTFVPPTDFFHMDSLDNANKSEAKKMANRFRKTFSLAGCKFIEKEHLIQGNNYDCGLHVIRNTIKTLEHVFSKDRKMTEQFAEYEQFSGPALREELLRLVQEIADNRG